MSRSHRIAVLAGASASAAALAATMAVPAQAAGSSGWRVFYRHHYGAAANYSGYFALVAPARDDAWAFGAANAALRTPPVAVHWNGSHWSPARLPGGLASGIGGGSASARNNVWYISQLGQYALRWNGRKWSVAKRWTGTGELTGVIALSPDNVWVFGGGGYIGGLGTWHYNGHSWTKFGGVANGIEGGSALSASSIWATGSIHSPGDSLAHYNGTRWSRVSAPALKNAQFNDIVAVSRGNVWAVGEPAGSITSGLVVHWDGRRWRKIAVPWQVQPRSVISDGQGGLWMTASSGSSGPGQVSWVLHRSKSGRWTRTRISTGAPGGLNDLALDPGTHAVWGAGDAATKAGSDAVIFAYGRVS